MANKSTESKDMDLKEFIASSLSQILMGVDDAIKETKGTKGAINPLKGEIMDNLEEITQLVKFDVAVTVSEKGTSEGGVGIKVMGIGLGANVKGSREQNNISVSRIQFAIPVALPVQTITE